MSRNDFKNKIINYDFNKEEDVIKFFNDLNQFLKSDAFNSMSVFTIIDSINILMNASFNLFNKVTNRRFENIANSKHFLFYDKQLELLAEKIVQIQRNVNKYYHISLLDNQATRTLLLFYKARLCADKTFMSLARYGRDGIILKMDENENAIDENGNIINDEDLKNCLDNLTKNGNNLRKPALLASNLESKSKVISSYFGFAGVIGDNAIISLQRENRQNRIIEDELNEDEETAEDIAFNEEVAEDEENRTSKSNNGYDVDKYDAFMISLIYKNDPLKSQIFLTTDEVFCNKLNKLVENEIEIRKFFRKIDDRYKVYRRIKGFNFSGFKTGLWIGYPNCKFYYKNDIDVWESKVVQDGGKNLSDILLTNYYKLTEATLKEEIRKKYIAHFKNLDDVFQTRLTTLRSIQNTRRWNGANLPAYLVPTDQELNALLLEWKALLKKRMEIISENFTVFSEAEYDEFFENNNIDTTISVIKLNIRK